MRRFILKTLWALSPLLPLAALYYALDPFRVVWHHEVFYDPDDSVWVNLNADYVATCTYDQRYAEEHYDAFIFGNSRSRYYPVADWRQHLPEGRHPYHFDAHSESLYAMTRKVEYIERQGRPLRDALLIIDRTLLEQDKAATPHLNHISPQLEGNTLAARVAFQTASLKAWFSPKFMLSYIDAQLFNTLRPYMVHAATMMKPYPYDPHTNEETMADEEARIAAGTYYDEPDIQRCFMKPQRPGAIDEAVIGQPERDLLLRMRDVFRRKGTDYHVVVSPLYDQVRLNPSDLAALEDIFGTSRVHDYSGVNAITADRHNYYEPYHYRPTVARHIMQEIYR